MAEMQTYTGGCHCGAVRYQVTTDFAHTMTCNCSLCGKMGWVLTFVPAAQFTLLQGQEQLTDYQFNKKVIHHYFCRVCGVRSFGQGAGPDGVPMYAINLRCVDGVDVAALAPQAFDGKSA